MINLRFQSYLNRVPPAPSLKFCGLKNVMKLGGCQENFKVTLLERPPEKSCSTSKLPSWRGLQKNHAQLNNFPEKSLEHAN